MKYLITLMLNKNRINSNFELMFGKDYKEDTKAKRWKSKR